MIHLNNEYIEVHAFQTAKRNNLCCGDSFHLVLEDDYFLCVLADGLGSGQYAYEASRVVTEIVEKNPEEDIQTLMETSNKKLLGTRGATVAILKVDFTTKTFEYSCVGNIRFYVYIAPNKLIYPMPVRGYLSGKPQKYRTHKYEYTANSKFLLYSDGFTNINTRELLESNKSVWSMTDYLKAIQNDNKDDMSFIVGTLL